MEESMRELDDVEKAASECSRHEEVAAAEEVAATKQQRATNATLPTKCLLVGVSAVLAVVNIFAVYSIVTWRDRVECFIGDHDTILPPFVWYTTWTLITTTVTWIVYLKRRYVSQQQTIEGSETSSPASSRTPALPTHIFRLCLPLSVAVMLGYTFYLVSNDWGSDFVDHELCYTLMDGAIPKENTTPVGAAIYLALDRLANFTAHCVCAVINVVLYWKAYTHEQALESSWGWILFPFIFIVVQSILIVLVHEFVGEVYSTDNIILNVAPTVLVFCILNAAFFYRRKRTKSKLQNHESTPVG